MLRWRKVKPIIRREYLSRTRTKAFWISTLAVPMVMIGFTILPTLLMMKSGGTFNVALVTAEKPIGEAVSRALAVKADTASDAGTMVVNVRVEAPAADRAAQRQALKRDIVAKKLNAAVILPDDILATGQPEYISTNVTALRLMSKLEKAVQGAVVRERLIRAGIAADRTAELTRAVDMQTVRINKKGEETEGGFEQTFIMSYILFFLLWLTMMMYGYYVLRGVLEEKSSRIVEVIIANLRPFELMTGKILGICAVGLTQYGIWMVIAMNLALPGLIGSATGMKFASGLSPMLLVYFGVFFLLGYFLYATMYVAVASAFNSEEEAQQMQSVVGWVMAIPMVCMMVILNNPDSTLAVVLSLIPFFAPSLFFLRMTVQFPPVWQVVLCFVLLIGTIILMARFAAAIYRVGILMYGKRPSLRELLRWARSN